MLENAGRLLEPPRTLTGKKVAIVGSGPAGLSAAYYLRQAGHSVTAFEKMPEAGGMLAYGFPAYRLLKTFVQKLIHAYERIDIEFVLNHDICTSDASLGRFQRDHDAVFLATSTLKQKTLPIARQELLDSGLEFLIDIQRSNRAVPGERVLVIGGECRGRRRRLGAPPGRQGRDHVMPRRA